jgi:hypothetical protein
VAFAFGAAPSARVRQLALDRLPDALGSMQRTWTNGAYRAGEALVRLREVAVQPQGASAMSTYCYQLPSGEIREEDFPIGTAPTAVRFGDGEMGERCVNAEWKRPTRELRGVTRGWPIESFSMGVNPVDRFTAMKDAAAHGVPTEFNKAGNPLMRDMMHQRKFNKYMKAHNKDGYFG